MALDRFERDVQLVGDFPVGAALGREPHNPKFAWGERLHPGAPLSPGAGASGLELLPRARRQPPSAAADRELEALRKRLPGSSAPAAAAQRRAELRQRIRELEQRR